MMKPDLPDFAGINAFLDKMLEQGNQLRASELIPVLKAIVEILASEVEAHTSA